MSKQAMDQSSHTPPGPGALPEPDAGRAWLAGLSESIQVF